MAHKSSNVMCGIVLVLVCQPSDQPSSMRRGCRSSGRHVCSAHCRNIFGAENRHHRNDEKTMTKVHKPLINCHILGKVSAKRGTFWGRNPSLLWVHCHLACEHFAKSIKYSLMVRTPRPRLLAMQAFSLQS